MRAGPEMTKKLLVDCFVCALAGFSWQQVLLPNIGSAACDTKAAADKKSGKSQLCTARHRYQLKPKRLDVKMNASVEGEKLTRTEQKTKKKNHHQVLMISIPES